MPLQQFWTTFFTSQKATKVRTNLYQHEVKHNSLSNCIHRLSEHRELDLFRRDWS